jgi:hypothetical protein
MQNERLKLVCTITSTFTGADKHPSKKIETFPASARLVSWWIVIMDDPLHTLASTSLIARLVAAQHRFSRKQPREDYR